MKARFGIVILSFVSGLFIFMPLNNATASTLTFYGQNAGLFGTANPADTSTLMNSVVKPNNPNATNGVNGLSSTQFILQSLESQIITRDYNQIFNTAPGQSGSFQVGSTTVSYSNNAGGTQFTITITTGTQSTTITVPE